jgi:hypothetical protein
MGLIVVTGDAANELKAAYDADPVLTAWGWQFEWQYETSLGGPSGLVEFVPLVLGTEQGLTIPTANLLFGIRTAGDKEFAVGPNVTGNGVGLTVVARWTAGAVAGTTSCPPIAAPRSSATRPYLIFSRLSGRNTSGIFEMTHVTFFQTHMIAPVIVSLSEPKTPATVS